MKVAKKFKDDGKTIHFAISDKDDLHHEVSEFGIDGSSFEKPVVAGRDSSGQKFVMTEEFR